MIIETLPKTRKNAKEIGSKYYFSICKRNHICPRNASNGTCVECLKLSKREYRQFQLENYLKADLVWCKCDCGQQIKPIDKVGRKVEYMSGHNNRKYPIGTTNYRDISRFRNPESRLLGGAKRRSKKKNLPMDITKGDINIPEICPVLDIPLFYQIGHKSATDNSPSLDRIDPKKGYVKGNIRVISFRANYLKCNANIDELKLVLKDLERIEYESNKD